MSLTKEAVSAILEDHTIECTGLGEVTCRACRDLRWMSWSQYRGHLANLIMALAPKGYLQFCSVTKYCRMADDHEGRCRP